MTEPSHVLGSERSGVVLDPSFVADLGELTTEEVRRRRDQSLAEREFLSYLRRLVQVRQDILVAERGRRRSGGDPQPLVERLTDVLAKGSKAGPARGEALRTALSEGDMEEAERLADSLLPGLAVHDPEGLDDQDLDHAVASLAETERTVSVRRSDVIRVHDRLQDELKRRYRENPTEIPTGV